jgi:cytochrome c-type biogenesis protein CcmE
VADGTIVRMPTGQDVTFVVTDGDATLPVRYHGIIPDTFVDGADVVVEGQLTGDGTFEAHTLLAKCPSKYEAADGTEQEMPGYGSDEPAPHE